MKYTDEQLKKLPTKNLYRHFQHVRACVSCFYPRYEDDFYCRSDLMSPEAMLAEDQEYDALVAYEQKIKDELQSRPYVAFSKKAVAQRRQETLADLRGNRNRPRDRQRRKAWA